MNASDTFMSPKLLIAALVGGLLGGIFGSMLEIGVARSDQPARVPLPHQVAKERGGISLRFAMVHDVIHERFPRHGKDYFQARNAAARAIVDRLVESRNTLPEEGWTQLEAAMDDLIVGCVHLGEFERAIQVGRDKLALQETAKRPDSARYSTFANLGTAMMIDALHRPISTDSAAADELRESLKLLDRAIQINPQSHFGREIWQKKLGEFLLLAVHDPNLLSTQDMIGEQLTRQLPANSRGESRAMDWSGGMSLRRLNLPVREEAVSEGLREHFREMIRRVGPETLAEGSRPKDESTSVPFDEPTLGIVGMWRYGGGANPHFAMCLGEIMLRVGQRYIAWSAYERAIRLASGISPDESVRKAFIQRCEARQREIEQAIDSADHAALVAAFESELQAGLAYQQAYQQYESTRIAAGAALNDEHFYDAFNQSHPSIASDPGDADEVVVAPYRRHPSLSLDRFLPMALLGSGAASLLTAISIAQTRRVQSRAAPAAR